MNTPRFWKNKYEGLRFAPDYAIDEIQRDAREGMVPVEDVRPLVNALVVIGAFGEGPEVTGSFDEPGSANLARIALSEDFRAKHPNLFTK